MTAPRAIALADGRLLRLTVQVQEWLTGDGVRVTLAAGVGGSDAEAVTLRGVASQAEADAVVASLRAAGLCFPAGVTVACLPSIAAGTYSYAPVPEGWGTSRQLTRADAVPAP